MPSRLCPLAGRSEIVAAALLVSTMSRECRAATCEPTTTLSGERNHAYCSWAAQGRASVFAVARLKYLPVRMIVAARCAEERPVVMCLRVPLNAPRCRR